MNRRSDNHALPLNSRFGIDRSKTGGVEPTQTLVDDQGATEPDASAVLRAGLSRLLDSLPAMVAYYDHKFHCSYANKAWLTRFGWRPEDLSGVHLQNLLGPDLYRKNERYVRAALTGEPQTFERELPQPDGSTGYMLAQYVPDVRPDGHVAGFFVLTSDVSALKKAERALEEKQAELEAALARNVVAAKRLEMTLERTETDLSVAISHSSDGFARISEAGVVTLTNQSFFHLLQLPEEIRACEPLTIALIDDYLHGRGDVYQANAKHLDNPNPQLDAGNIECANGRILEMRIRALPEGAQMRTYADITARVKAERALRDSEALYRMMANATSDINSQFNFDLSRRFVSQAAKGILGYETEELLSLPLKEIIHPEDYAELYGVMRALLAGAIPGDNATIAYRKRKKSGDWIWIEGAINLVRDSVSGAPQSLLTSERDITERQRIAKHMSQARDAAETLARSKSEFIANMSHELRTPLSGILGVHDLLDGDATLNPVQRRQVRMARDAGRALLGVINDVLDFSKIEAGEMKIESLPFNVRDLMENCRELCAEQAKKKGLQLRVDLSGGPEVLIADAGRLRQIILNLTTNAIKFTDHGHVALAASNQPTGRLRIEVRDSGIGIAEDKLHRLFNRFSQTDTSITRRYGGTGLGLAISKRLVDLMGGEIGVHTTEGAGSTFWFEIPVTDEAMPAPLTSSASDRALTPRLNILLAEDNPINSEIIQCMLERFGHAVSCVGNGEEALSAVRRGDRFDLILLDVQMPVMDGLVATQAIREVEQARESARIPIIGLTANALAHDVERCLQAGMQAHVAKPVDWDHLFATIQRVLVQAQTDTPTLEIATPDAVFTPTPLDRLGDAIGRHRVSSLLWVFIHDLEHLSVELGSIDALELSRRAHVVKSTAGQLGFPELSNIGSVIEREAFKGQGSLLIPEFRLAVERSIVAAKASDYYPTAQASAADPPPMAINRPSAHSMR